MDSIWSGKEGKPVVVFGQRYFLLGTLERWWFDPLGVAIGHLGADTVQWWYEDGDKTGAHFAGPRYQEPFGAIDVPSTAIGLGVQLASDKWPKEDKAPRRRRSTT